MRELVIGIDLGGTNIKGALLDGQGNIEGKQQVATMASAGPQAVASRIAGLLTELEKLAVKKGAKVSGIGIGVPGQPDKATGTVVFAPNLGWREVPLVSLLRSVTGLPVYLENDANAAALGEKWRGAGRASQNMIMITIGTGIGGGLILNGRLYSGTTGTAGELGHTIIDPEGPQCSCGRRGCLETLTSATAMVRMAKEFIAQGRSTVLEASEKLNAKAIVEAARAGDEVAGDIVGKAAYYLGLGLANLINIFNPDTIVIGGGVARCGTILLEPMRNTAMEWALQAPAKIVKIVPAELGNDAGCIGAGALVLHENWN